MMVILKGDAESERPGDLRPGKVSQGDTVRVATR